MALGAGSGSTSSPPGAVVRRRSMTIRGERRQGEVLITVDGSPLDWRSSLAVRNHSPPGTRRGSAGRWMPATSSAGAIRRRRGRTNVVRLVVEER